MNVKINPIVAVIVILAVATGVGWLIYSNTQAQTVNLPYKSPEQRAAEAKQMAAGMRMGASKKAKPQKAKPTGQATSKPKPDDQSDNSPKPEQKTTQGN